MKKLSTLLLTAFVAAFAVLPFFAGSNVSAAANAKDAICSGAGGSGADNCTINGQPSVNGTLKRVVNLIIRISAVAAVIMIIVGGFRYVTSGGDSGTVSSAKRTIAYAAIGLVIVGAAQMIVGFVLTDIL